jgi:hypothetical protein
MRKWAIVVCVFGLLSLVAVAQEEAAAPKAVIFGGYSYLRNNSNGFNGWEGQGTFNVNRFFGITADLSGNYRTAASFSALGFSVSANQHMYNFLFGPTATASLGRSSVFAHALFGEAHSGLGAGVGIPIIGGISTGVTSANSFAMAFGGGVDIGLTRHFAIRAAQLDYVRTQFNATDALAAGLSTGTGNRQNSFRYSAGIVFRF